MRKRTLILRCALGAANVGLTPVPIGCPEVEVSGLMRVRRNDVLIEPDAESRRLGEVEIPVGDVGYAGDRGLDPGVREIIETLEDLEVRQRKAHVDGRRG